MGFGGGAKAPKPPAPLPPATPQSEETLFAADDARRRLRQAKGRQSTILAGGLGGGQVAKKTLLGG